MTIDEVERVYGKESADEVRDLVRRQRIHGPTVEMWFPDPRYRREWLAFWHLLLEREAAGVKRMFCPLHLRPCIPETVEVPAAMEFPGTERLPGNQRGKTVWERAQGADRW